MPQDFMKNPSVSEKMLRNGGIKNSSNKVVHGGVLVYLYFDSAQRDAPLIPPNSDIPCANITDI